MSHCISEIAARSEPASWKGLVAGTNIGAAIANSQPRYYAPEPGYVAYAGYGEPYPVACPGGYWSRQPIAFDAYGNPVGWSRPSFVCP